MHLTSPSPQDNFILIKKKVVERLKKGIYFLIFDIIANLPHRGWFAHLYNGTLFIYVRMTCLVLWPLFYITLILSHDISVEILMIYIHSSIDKSFCRIGYIVSIIYFEGHSLLTFSTVLANWFNIIGHYVYYCICFGKAVMSVYPQCIVPIKTC